MRRLPKGLKKVLKSEFVDHLLISSEKNDSISNEEEKIYDEWSKVTKKKQHRQTFRW